LDKAATFGVSIVLDHATIPNAVRAKRSTHSAPGPVSGM
jgi:hypothetical protein